MRFIHVASVSSGKDSQATMLLMIDRVGLANCKFVFADTGNEDTAVFEHLDYLRQKLGIQIDVLRADFSEQIANKRTFIARDQRVGRKYDTRKIRVVEINDNGICEEKFRLEKYGRGRRVRWTNKAKRRALSILHPTGNPYLDLCLWKGRFPSRKAQFCTQELKTMLLVEYQMALVDQGYGVVSWQGVRRDESANRRNAKLFERVGCMPCINCGKKEIKNIALRKPAEIERLAEWERLVAMASKRGEASFFPNPDREREQDKRGIYKMVQWAKTTHGGRQFDLISEIDGAACASSYGLCE